MTSTGIMYMSHMNNRRMWTAVSRRMHCVANKIVAGVYPAFEARSCVPQSCQIAAARPCGHQMCVIGRDWKVGHTPS